MRKNNKQLDPKIKQDRKIKSDCKLTLDHLDLLFGRKDIQILFPNCHACQHPTILVLNDEGGYCTVYSLGVVDRQQGCQK